jgi:hypothetical protein
MDHEEIRLRIVEKVLECRVSVDLISNPCKITTVADVLFAWVTQKSDPVKVQRRRSGVENG